MKNIQLEDLKDYKSLSSLSLSTNGKHGIFCVTHPNIESNDYSSDIWTYSKKDNSTEQVTYSGKVHNVTFLSDTHILYSEINESQDIKRVRMGEYLSVFYKQDISNKHNSKERLFELPLKKAKAIAITSDLLLISSVRDSSRPNFESLSEDERKLKLSEYKREEDYEICDEVPFFADSRGFINKKRNSLYLYEISTKKLTEVTNPLFETSKMAICPDKKSIAFSGVRYDHFLTRSHGVYLYNIENEETIELLEPGKYQIMELDFYAGDLIIAAHPWDGYSPFPNHDLYLLNLETKRMELVYKHEHEDFGAKISSDVRFNSGTTFKVSNDKLYYLTTLDQTSYLNVWTKTDNTIKLTKSNIAVDFFATNGGNIFLVGLKDDSLQELYSLNSYTNELERKSSFNNNLKKEVMSPIPHSFINSDGIRIDGFVIKPFNYDSSKIYPGVLEIHGGPRTSYSFVYSHEMQLLASNGYFVFYCNPRGSSGRGEDFADINGRRGTVDYKDVIEFTNYIISIYSQMDKNRLAVMGGSYGGYLTNWIIGHTDVFKAAISMRSIVDVNGSFGATDYSVWSTIGAYGGTPWVNRDKVWEQSPLKYALNIKTPTLFLHSFEDYRCSIHGAMQLFTTLKSRGVPSRMCLFKNESHELSRSGAPRNKIKRLEEIVRWLDTYLKNVK